MKKLQLKTPAFRYLEQSFREWLDILGYAPSTVRQLPICVREFLHYLEAKQNITQITQIDTPIIHTYYRSLSQRGNQRLGGGLSNNYLNVHLHALDKLLEYLRKQGKLILPPLGIPNETPNPQPVQPLTPEQVKSLYQATETHEAPEITLRDKAILAVYYDCGLRRKEGEQLNTTDINLDSRLLHVRKGKGSRERYVPFGQSTKNHFQSWLYDGRPKLLKDNRESAFLLNKSGARASGNLMNRQLKTLKDQSTDASLQHMPLHLHILRHSIATHLLYQGMELEKVAQFLGHRSLESTQIYTHLIEKVYG